MTEEHIAVHLHPQFRKGSDKEKFMKKHKQFVLEFALLHRFLDNDEKEALSYLAMLYAAQRSYKEEKLKQHYREIKKLGMEAKQKLGTFLQKSKKAKYHYLRMILSPGAGHSIESCLAVIEAVAKKPFKEVVSDKRVTVDNGTDMFILRYTTMEEAKKHIIRDVVPYTRKRENVAYHILHAGFITNR